MTIIHHENNDAVLDSSNRKFQPPFPRDDEIDLIEWLLIAIKSYKTILIITFCFGLIGYGIAKICRKNGRVMRLLLLRKLRN